MPKDKEEKGLEKKFYVLSFEVNYPFYTNRRRMLVAEIIFTNITVLLQTVRIVIFLLY